MTGSFVTERGKPNFCRISLISTYLTGSLGSEWYDWKRQVWWDMGTCVCRSRGGVPLPLASCSAPLLVVLDRDNEED